jgi:hypothetical protein
MSDAPATACSASGPDRPPSPLRLAAPGRARTHRDLLLDGLARLRNLPQLTWTAHRPNARTKGPRTGQWNPAPTLTTEGSSSQPTINKGGRK